MNRKKLKAESEKFWEDFNSQKSPAGLTYTEHFMRSLRAGWGTLDPEKIAALMIESNPRLLSEGPNSPTP